MKSLSAVIMLLLASLAVCSTVQAQQGYEGEQKPYASHHRIADKKFWLAVAVNTAATVFNVEVTHHCLVQGTCTSNPMFGREPSRLRMYGTALPIQGLFGLTTLLVKKHDQSDERIGGSSSWIPRWVSWNSAYTTANTVFGVSSLLTERPVIGTEPRPCPGRGCN
jgi:hypothetical protein